MALNQELANKLAARKQAIQANWPYYRQLAAAGYAKSGRGTVALDLAKDCSAESHENACLYLDEEQVKVRLSDSFAILIRLGEYNPEREILFTFLDFKSMSAQTTILGEREDGVPCGRGFNELPGGNPSLGTVASPIVDDRPDTEAVANFDELLAAINDKVTRADEDALNADERAIWDIVELQYQVQNGGFDQYFFNCGRRWQPTSEALRRVGAERLAALFDRVCARFPQGKPPAGDALWDELEQLSDSEDDLWDKEDSEFYELDDALPEILWHFWTSPARGRRGG